MNSALPPVKKQVAAPWLLVLNRICFLTASVCVLFAIYAILTGFPPVIAGKIIKLKNLKPPFLIFLFSVLGIFFIRPNGLREGWPLLERRLESLAQNKKSLWILFVAAAVLFTWQQVTEYLAIQINFLPFSFYDYMLYYYFHGKIHFTGLLHTYYHINNILFLLAPLWKIFQSPWLLVLSYGGFAALAILPLYSMARERFNDKLAALLTSALYLNYRYLQNVLQMNFSPEIFYPLFLFWTVSAALKRQWPVCYLAVFLGLSVKEDSFLYFGAIGALIFMLKKRGVDELVRSNRIHGAIIMLLAPAYYFFITRIFMPWTGNNLLAENFNNFPTHGSSEGEILFSFIKNPVKIFSVFFGSSEKLTTWFNLLYRLGFLPLFSPAALLIFAPIFPLFMHQTGRDTDFINLHFHYAAAVLPFVFIAFVFGFSNLLGKIRVSWRKPALIGIMIILFCLNGGHYRTEKITAETLKSIHWAQNIPPGINLVTHGHLLPYAGYLQYNYYFSAPFELAEHPYRTLFMNADYYLLDKTVNSYPMDPAYVDQKIQTLREDPRYELVLEDPSKRYLFRKRK